MRTTQWGPPCDKVPTPLRPLHLQSGSGAQLRPLGGCVAEIFPVSSARLPPPPPPPYANGRRRGLISLEGWWRSNGQLGGRIDTGRDSSGPISLMTPTARSLSPRFRYVEIGGLTLWSPTSPGGPDANCTPASTNPPPSYSSQLQSNRQWL